MPFFGPKSEASRPGLLGPGLDQIKVRNLRVYSLLILRFETLVEPTHTDIVPTTNLPCVRRH